MKVRIDVDRYTRDQKNCYNLFNTHNGYQWTGMTALTIDELKQIRDYINDFIEEVESGTEDQEDS